MGIRFTDKGMDSVSSRFRREIHIRPGLWMSLIDCFPEQRIQIDYNGDLPVVNFGFILSGTIENNIECNYSGKKILNNKEGMSGIQFLKKPKGSIKIYPQKRVQVLHIHSTPQFLQSLLKKDLQILKSGFRSVIEGDMRKNYIRRGTINPHIQAVIHQIMNIPGNLIPRHLYLESKALELISLQIAGLDSGNKKLGQSLLLSKEEKKRIPCARDLLIKNLEAPPTLKNLSSYSGISINKLQAGFRERYGSSVFGFLREYKLQKAKILLEQTKMNVSQTAWAVGYVNVSHFSAAFKKKFGILPKHYLKESKRTLFVRK